MNAPRYDPSRDRQELSRIPGEFSSILHVFCDHGPLLKGSLRILSRRCGKPRCRCATGKPHRTTVFIDRREEKPFLHKVTGADYRRLSPPAAAYRKVRALRARLSHLYQEMLDACDRLTLFRVAEGNQIRSRKESI